MLAMVAARLSACFVFLADRARMTFLEFLLKRRATFSNRTRVLNEDLDDLFRRWYPKFRSQPQRRSLELLGFGQPIQRKRPFHLGLDQARFNYTFGTKELEMLLNTWFAGKSLI
jgi:hypothetical protein